MSNPMVLFTIIGLLAFQVTVIALLVRARDAAVQDRDALERKLTIVLNMLIVWGKRWGDPPAAVKPELLQILNDSGLIDRRDV